MLEIGDTLKEVYNCDHAVIIPGSGTYAMEAAARQFATGKKAIVLRNGFFSYRWTQIFESCGIPTDHLVLKAQAVDDSPKPQFAPHPVDHVVATIMKEKPAVLFAPHVETSTGMILPDDYIKKVADAMHPGRRHHGARLHRVGHRVGRHEEARRRRPHLGAAERGALLARNSARNSPRNYLRV